MQYKLNMTTIINKRAKLDNHSNSARHCDPFYTKDI